MSIDVIQTTKAPAAIGPYSQAIRAGEFLFVSGQIPINPETGELLGDDVALQTKMVLENLKGIVEAAGSGMDAVVKTTVFLADMGDFPIVNEIYKDYFTKYPARSCVEVSRLPKDVKVEIEAVVYAGK